MSIVFPNDCSEDEARSRLKDAIDKMDASNLQNLVYFIYGSHDKIKVEKNSELNSKMTKEHHQIEHRTVHDHLPWAEEDDSFLVSHWWGKEHKDCQRRILHNKRLAKKLKRSVKACWVRQRLLHKGKIHSNVQNSNGSGS